MTGQRGDLGGAICIKLHLGKCRQGAVTGSEHSEGQAGKEVLIAGEGRFLFGDKAPQKETWTL